MDDERVTGLPASIEAAWGLRQRPARGPKRGLSLERIVAAAVKVAASEGLAAVSMKRVAAELGIGTMSLYRYVAAKDELLALMVDAAAFPLPASSAPGEGWRAGLTRWAWAQRTLLQRHPWVLRIPIGGPPVTPNQVAWMERALRCLAGTSLTEAEKLGVVLLLATFVRSEATLVADIAAAAGSAGSTALEGLPTYGRLLACLTDAGDFPALRAVIAAGVFDAPEASDDPDADFEFGLERVLDGIETLIQSRTAAHPSTPQP